MTLSTSNLSNYFLHYCLCIVSSKRLYNKFSIHSFSSAMLSALKLWGDTVLSAKWAHILEGSSANVL